jgi:hypothetical protein
MLNCVFLVSGNCNLSFADVDCSGDLSPADVVLELNAVFLAAAFPCYCNEFFAGAGFKPALFFLV